MKFNALRAGAAISALAMMLEATMPGWFFFLPLAGSQLEQFAVFVGGAYVLQELYASLRG